MNFFRNKSIFLSSSLVIIASLLFQTSLSTSAQPVITNSDSSISSGVITNSSVANSANSDQNLINVPMFSTPIFPNSANSVSNQTLFSTSTISGFSSMNSSMISSLSNSSSVSSLSQSTMQVSTQNVTGELLSIQNNTLTVKDGDKTSEFVIPDNIKITRNSLEARLNDLKPRDQVTIIKTNDQVISVEAMDAGKTSDIAKFAIPLLILLIIIIGIILYFWNKNNKGKIKTTTTNLQ